MKAIQIAAGCEHSAIISDQGILLTWGHGDGGRLGHGENNQCLLPTPVQALSMMKLLPQDVHCGDKFTIILVKPIFSLDDKAESEHNNNSSSSTSSNSHNNKSFHCIPFTSTSTSPSVKYSERWFQGDIAQLRDELTATTRLKMESDSLTAAPAAIAATGNP